MHYVVEGIILRKQEIKDSQWILTLLTKEYGKIRGFIKPQKNIHFDLGQIVETHIRRKGETNSITSIRTKVAVGGQKNTFETVFNFLQILGCIDTHIPENGTEQNIYEDLRYLINHQWQQSLTVELLRLMELRILVLFQQEISFFSFKHSLEIHQHMNESQEKSIRIAKKLEAISQNHTLEEIIRIQGIPSTSLDIFHSEFLHNFFPGQ